MEKRIVEKMVEKLEEFYEKEWLIKWIKKRMMFVSKLGKINKVNELKYKLR
jgi:hypothetical protein